MAKFTNCRKQVVCSKRRVLAIPCCRQYNGLVRLLGIAETEALEDEEDPQEVG